VAVVHDTGGERYLFHIAGRINPFHVMVSLSNDYHPELAEGTP
jgi:hypothetical protein